MKPVDDLKKDTERRKGILKIAGIVISVLAILLGVWVCAYVHYLQKPEWVAIGLVATSIAYFGVVLVSCFACILATFEHYID